MYTYIFINTYIHTYIHWETCLINFHFASLISSAVANRVAFDVERPIELEVNELLALPSVLT